MTYEPGLIPRAPVDPDLALFIQDELRRISIEFSGVDSILLPQLDIEPDKPRDGMIILADGTNFDPGSGAGFYGRSAGAWVKSGNEAYEEGTFTPVLTDGTNDAPSQSLAVGFYTRIGDRVFFTLRVRAGSSLGSVAGDIKIKGLPFISSSATDSYSPVAVGFANNLNLGTAGDCVVGFVHTAGDFIELQVFDLTTGITNMDAAVFSVNGDIIISGTYGV